MKKTTTLLTTLLVASAGFLQAQKNSDPNETSKQETGENQPRLFEPYAPKPSHPIPEGWELQILQGSKVENKTTLKNKKEVKVTVPAYQLIPITSAAQNNKPLVISDPGFKPELANNQTDTLGAVLTQYSETTTGLHDKLSKIIQELEKNLQTTPQETETAPKNEEKKPNRPAR